jgi:hypothetical protein
MKDEGQKIEKVNSQRVGTREPPAASAPKSGRAAQPAAIPVYLCEEPQSDSAARETISSAWAWLIRPCARNASAA